MTDHRNPDGTFNGVSFFSQVTGLDQEEIKWTMERIRQLLHVEGKTKEEAKSIVREEQKLKPWVKK